MKRILLAMAIVLGVVCATVPSSVFAADKHYISCDACGLCPKIVNIAPTTCTVVLTPTPPALPMMPGDWKSCVKCLYPSLFPEGSDPDPRNCNTLLINENTGLPKYPAAKGVQFTMLGCIKSGSTLGFDNGQASGQRGAPTVVQALLNVLFSLAGGLAFLYLLYGGFIILTSQADPERLNYGKRLIYGSIVGLILTFGSVFIVNFLGSGILHIPGFSGATP